VHYRLPQKEAIDVSALGSSLTMQIVSVMNDTRATLIGDRVEVANTSFGRLVGLLGRRNLAPGGGLWIRPSSGVHTVGMLFPIDVVGLDKKLTVIKLWKNLVPYRVTSVSWTINSVIELPSGRIAEAGIQIGDSLRMI
jgi:uncharacterized membrane protein (UPF0127 family)